MHKFSTADADQRWNAIVNELGERRARLVERFLDRVSLIQDYSTDLPGYDDVRRTAAESLQLLTESLAGGRAGAQLLDFAGSLGARRARQGVPPESLISAVRLDFSILWSELLEICAPGDAALLAGRVEHVWRVVDEYATRTHVSYLAERVRMAQEETNFKQEFISRLFGPMGQAADVVANAAAALEVDADGEYALAAASGAGARALRNVATTGIRSKGLFLHQSGSMTFIFWQAGPAERGRRKAASAAGALSSVPCGFVEGIPGLRAVAAAAGTAASLAQLVNEADTGPLTMERGWARLAREKMREAGLDLKSQLHAGLSLCTPAERERLEETVRVFMQSGSVSDTAGTLYCHRNTILNRLRRFQDLTGLDLMVPVQAARAVIAWS